MYTCECICMRSNGDPKLCAQKTPLAGRNRKTNFFIVKFPTHGFSCIVRTMPARRRRAHKEGAAAMTVAADISRQFFESNFHLLRKLELDIRDIRNENFICFESWREMGYGSLPTPHRPSHSPFIHLLSGPGSVPVLDRDSGPVTQGGVRDLSVTTIGDGDSAGDGGGDGEGNGGAYGGADGGGGEDCGDGGSAGVVCGGGEW